MLESFIKIDGMVKRPYIAFLWAFILSIIAFFLTGVISYNIRINGTLLNLGGLISIILIILPSAYLATNLINNEELLEERLMVKKHKNKSLWKRHEKDMLIFLNFFFGATLAFAVSSFFLPHDFFQIQKTEIGRIIGVSSSITGRAVAGLSFSDIFFNNFGVLVLSFIFSFLFGAGLVFILTWNASLLGVRIAQLSGSIADIPSKSLPFLPHGIFEIASFVLAGLSGGIISFAILRERRKKTVFAKVLADSTLLFMLAVVCLAVGAFIEVL